MKKLNRKKILCYIVLLVVALVMCIPLFQKGLHPSHDGEFHMSRVVGTLEQLQQGNSPYVVSRFSNNLGFAWNLFYPPMTTLITSIFTFITNNIVIGMKLFIFTTFILSGITMFQFVHTLTKNKFAALLAGIFYMAAPYRLLNTYTRLAVGEMVSFIFVPIILNGVNLLLQGKTNKSYLYILGTIGLILSHNISTMLVFLIGFFFVLGNLKKLKDTKILKTFCISTVIIILSVLFFEVPLLEQKSAVDFEVFRYGKMYSQGSVYNSALNPLQLLFKHVAIADSPMYFCIGIFLLGGILLSPFMKKYRKPSYQKMYRFIFKIGIVAIIMSTFLFPWFLMPDILLMIQFPWRMLLVIVFCFSIISGINWSIFIEKLAKKIGQKIKNVKLKKVLSITHIYYALLTILILSSTLYGLSFTKDVKNQDFSNATFQEVEIIDAFWDVSRYSSYLEYWPQKAIDYQDDIISHNGKTNFVTGEATISEETKVNGILNFDFSQVQDNTTIELPYLYYKGYQVIYTPENSNETKQLETVESKRGLVQIALDSSMAGHIQVEYHATPLHKICIFISSLTFIGYLIYLGIHHFKNKKKNEKIDSMQETKEKEEIIETTKKEEITQ